MPSSDECDHPGIGGALLRAYSELTSGAEHPDTKIVNFLSAPNLINALHPQVGQCYRVYIGLNTGMDVAHLVKSVVGALSQAGSSDAEVEFKSINQYSSSQAGEVERKAEFVRNCEKRIKAIELEIKRYVKIKPINEADVTDLIAAQRKIIETSEESIRTARSEVETEREKYQKHYSQWQPIYAILEKALKDEPGLKSSDYPDIKFFLTLTEQFYGFSPSRIDRLGFEPVFPTLDDCRS